MGDVVPRLCSPATDSVAISQSPDQRDIQAEKSNNVFITVIFSTLIQPFPLQESADRGGPATDMSCELI